MLIPDQLEEEEGLAFLEESLEYYGDDDIFADIEAVIAEPPQPQQDEMIVPQLDETYDWEACIDLVEEEGYIDDFNGS